MGKSFPLSTCPNYADVSACRTGYGQHGDYIFGWKGNVLQTAMESACFGATCKALKTQAFTDANKCAVPVTVKEDVTDGCKFLSSSLRLSGASELTWLRCRAHNTSRDGQLSVANVAGRSLCHQRAYQLK
jgi:hypothetical protein